jgi:DNA-binding MarR family transcriptional regulator
LNLTEEGRKKVENYSPIVSSIRMKAWENLTDEDFSSFTRILDKIYNNLSN